jgi:hypothetical protein
MAGIGQQVGELLQQRWHDQLQRLLATLQLLSGLPQLRRHQQGVGAPTSLGGRHRQAGSVALRAPSRT